MSNNTLIAIVALLVLGSCSITLVAKQNSSARKVEACSAAGGEWKADPWWAGPGCHIPERAHTTNTDMEA